MVKNLKSLKSKKSNLKESKIKANNKIKKEVMVINKNIIWGVLLQILKIQNSD